MARQRVYKRKSKEERKNLKFWAEGSREDVLRPHIEAYADALNRGWQAERECLNAICDEYHARISWRLEDYEEPPLPLPEYNATVGGHTGAEVLTEEEKAAKRARIKTLNARIRRWLKNRVRTLRKAMAPKLDPGKNPYSVLLTELSGAQPPRKARQPYQQFMHESFKDVILPMVEKRWAQKVRDENLAADARYKAPFRAEIARDMFKSLPQEEQERYRASAKREALEAKVAYERALKEKPSTTPEARQKCIDGLPGFLAPLLQGIHDRTKLNVVVLLGGCIPKYGGEIGTYHISHGLNSGASELYFPQWQKERFDKQVLGFYREFLATAFTDQDRKEAALPEDQVLDRAPYRLNGYGSSASESSESSESGSESDTDSHSSLDSDALHRRLHKTKAAGKRRAPTPTADRPPAKKRKSMLKNSAASSTASTSTAPYSPYSATDPSGPLIPPEPGNYEQEKAYNIANNRRLLQPLRQEIMDAVNDLGIRPPANLVPPGEPSAPKPCPKPRPKKLTSAQPNRRSNRKRTSTAIAGEVHGGAAGREEAGRPSVPATAAASEMADAMNAASVGGMVASAAGADGVANTGDATSASGSTDTGGAGDSAVDGGGTAGGSGGSGSGTTGGHGMVDGGGTAGGENAVDGGGTAGGGGSGGGTTGGNDMVDGGGTAGGGGGGTTGGNDMVDGGGTAGGGGGGTTGGSDVVDSGGTAGGENAVDGGGTAGGGGGGGGTTGGDTTAVRNDAASSGGSTDINGATGGGGSVPDSTSHRDAVTAGASTQGPPAAAVRSLSVPLASSNEVPQCPEHASPWMKDGWAGVSSVNLGEPFSTLIGCWIQLEGAYGFERGASALPKKGRPEELSKWIASGRGRSKPPKVPLKRLKAYAEIWWVWWGSLQPDWRARSPEGRPLAVGNYQSDWGKLHTPGQNGMLSVVATLYWWGCSLLDNAVRDRHDWDLAVAEVTWVLNGLLRSLACT